MASSVRKKSNLCRYFIKYGDCFHGENCQFIHALPPQQSSPEPQSSPFEPPPLEPVNQVVPEQPLPTPQQQAHRMNKLICSLKSHLPNEIHFAMQVATVLANSDNFSWSNDYALVDAICSSLHIYICVCEDGSTCYCYPRFWRKLFSKHSSSILLQAACPDNSSKNFDTLEHHSLADQSKIYKKIKITAELIKQFSMTIESSKSDKTNQNNYNYHCTKKKTLKVSPTLLNFVSLLLFCDDVALNIIGIDILSNTASKLSKLSNSKDDPYCSKLVQMFQEYCVDCIMSSSDIYFVRCSVEIVTKIIASSSRKSIVNIMNKKDFNSRLEQLLTNQHDVLLFMSTLECVFQISSHQPNLLTGTKYLLRILLNLLNCEDRHFSQSALKRIQLSGVDDNAAPPPPQRPLPSALTTAPPTKSVTVAPTSAPLKTTPQALGPKKYTCVWDDCKVEFTEPKQVYNHVFTAHIQPLPSDGLFSCLWSGPNGSGPGCVTKRPKYSLLTHLNDFHCSQAALEHPMRPPEHPGYAPNAAILAIRRHANEKKEDKDLSIISISIRITAALTLRNLASVSSDIKQTLESHEHLLSEICMTGRDESKIIAECLSLF